MDVRSVYSTALAATLYAFCASPALAADTSQNNRWSPWLGCWQAEGAPASEVVCIVPDGAGVRMRTLVDGVARSDSRIIADGSARRIQEVGCTGTERARWSSDGHRVFLDSDMSCERTARRTVRGMFVFVAPDQWVSVQSATSGDSVATSIVRFAAVNDAARAAFSERSSMLNLTESDVAEAVERVGAVAVQEWMRTAGEPFQLGYASQQRGGSSALEQVGRLSNPVVTREVVRIVERPVYVHNTYVTHRYDWHYSPWGYHAYGWHWSQRPILVVHSPIVIYRNNHYRHDWRDRSRRDYRDYSHRDRDRYRNYDRDRNHDHDWRGGRATRSGYTNTRDRATPDRARTSTAPARSSTRSSTATSRSSTGTSRATITRTARARNSSSSNRR